MSCRIAVLALVAVLSSSHSRAAALRACIPDYPSAPFSMPSGEASGQRVVALAVKRLGDEIQFSSAPWARCLAGMNTGDYELILGVEPDSEIYPYIAYPEKAGKVDPSRRLGTVEYVLVQKMSSTQDRRSIKDIGQPVVVVPRSIQAVSKRLASAGALLKSLNYDPGRFASLLCHDRAEVIVLRRGDSGVPLSGCGSARSVDIQLRTLVATDVYLGVRKSLLQERPDLGESIWKEVGRIRATPDWPADLDQTH